MRIIHCISFSSFVPAIHSFNYKYEYLIPDGKRDICRRRKKNCFAQRIRIQFKDTNLMMWSIGFYASLVHIYIYRCSSKWNPQTTMAIITYSNEWYNCSHFHLSCFACRACWFWLINYFFSKFLRCHNLSDDFPEFEIGNGVFCIHCIHVAVVPHQRHQTKLVTKPKINLNYTWMRRQWGHKRRRRHDPFITCSFIFQCFRCMNLTEYRYRQYVALLRSETISTTRDV